MSFFHVKTAYASLDSFVRSVNKEIINPLIVFLFALAVAYFLYGVFEFMFNQASEEKKTTGKSHMLWGVVGITIMMGVWFLLGLIIDTFNIQGINPQTGEVNISS